jgi:hypothetical protein
MSTKNSMRRLRNKAGHTDSDNVPQYANQEPQRGDKKMERRISTRRSISGYKEHRPQAASSKFS